MKMSGVCTFSGCDQRPPLVPVRPQDLAGLEVLGCLSGQVTEGVGENLTVD